jgi:hypothetical protein
VQVDVVTGEFVDVSSEQRCTRFGMHIAITPDSRGRLVLREPELSQRVPFPELALHEVTTSGEAGANTLFVLVRERWNPEIEQAIRAGLANCGRSDAGLALVVLWRDGSFPRADRDQLAAIEGLGRESGVPLLLNEDVGGEWTRALGLPDDANIAWALVGPSGSVTWRHSGHVDAGVLTETLDARLQQSAPPRALPVRSGLSVGDRLGAAMLTPSFIEAIESLQRPCPPIPIARARVGATTTLAFVRKDSAASEAQLRSLFAESGQQEEPRTEIIAIVDRASAKEIEELQNRLGVDVVALADLGGEITNRFRVSTWPTTVELSPEGVVLSVQTGLSSDGSARGVSVRTSS